MTDDPKSKKPGPKGPASEKKSAKAAEPDETNPSIVRQAEASKKAQAKAGLAFTVPASNPWSGAWKVAAGIGVVGAVAAAAGFAADPRRFAFSYLFAFEVFLSLALGMIFFVLVQHLTSAGWSVTVRRTAELFGSAAFVLALLYLPVWALRGQLFPWVHTAKTSTTETTSAQTQGARDEAAGGQAGVGERSGEAARGGAASATTAHGEAGDPLELAEERVIESKRPYLNEGFFTLRAIVYFAIWAWIGWKLLSDSAKQDTTRDPQATVRMQRFAPLATVLFALTLTFAGFDWIMSLEPSWFSTIFGVYLFAGCVVSSLALMIIVTLLVRRSGLLTKEINTEHFHDLGKLMFGFLVFWAYIGFSQFMLIWYAALPEETTFFHHRWDEGPWAAVSLALVFAHFVIPFFMLMSRNVKRRLEVLAFGSVWLLVMHVVDVYWLVMPNYGQAGFGVHWLDLACLLAVGGLYMAAVLYQMRRYPLIPVGDPRLPRALHFENA